MSNLTLITSEVCPYAQRTRIVLGEKGIAHEQVEIDLNDKPAWLADLTPANRVPVIRHGEVVLWESAVVNEYLDAVFDGPALRPTDEAGRAMVHIESRHFDSVFLPVFYKLLFEQDEAAQEKLRGEVEDGLRFLESRLEVLQGAGPYWLGDRMGLIDAAVFPFFERIPVFEHYRGLRIPDDCPRLHRWFEVMRAHPVVAETCHSLEYFIPLYAQYARGAGDGLSAQAFRSGAAN